jgi:hypothetical protein
LVQFTCNRHNRQYYFVLNNISKKLNNTPDSRHPWMASACVTGYNPWAARKQPDCLQMEAQTKTASLSCHMMCTGTQHQQSCTSPSDPFHKPCHIQSHCYWHYNRRHIRAREGQRDVLS